MFTGFSAPFVGQLNIQEQAALYGKTPVQITYFVRPYPIPSPFHFFFFFFLCRLTGSVQNSAASAGLATGGYLWWPLSNKFGRSSVILWTLVGQLVAQIWAPLMTRPDQYAAYLVSRYFSAFFGVTVGLLGPRYLVDLYFLHQRGRAFTVLHLALNFGASAGPTFGGFVAANGRSWPVEYWWSIALTGFSIIMVVLFLEETYFDRGVPFDESKEESWVRNRIDTFLPGTKVAAPTTWKHTVRIFSLSLSLSFSFSIFFLSLVSFTDCLAQNRHHPIQNRHRPRSAHNRRLRHHLLWLLRCAQRPYPSLAANADSVRRNLRVERDAKRGVYVYPLGRLSRGFTIWTFFQRSHTHVVGLSQQTRHLEARISSPCAVADQWVAHAVGPGARRRGHALPTTLVR